MLIDTELHQLAALLLRNHGEDALTYALRNAGAERTEGSEIGRDWMRVARKIEHLIAAGSRERRLSDA